MSKRVWHIGPPPHVGWWNISNMLSGDTQENTGLWSWWDGEQYGGLMLDSEDLNLPSTRAFAEVRSAVLHPSRTLWSDYWPENARVSRIDPRKVK